MRAIILPIAVDSKKAESGIKSFASYAARELAKVNSGNSGSTGGSGIGGTRSFGLAETQISGYRKLADQIGNIREHFETAQKAAGAFGETFKGSFLGNLASNVVQNLTGQIEALGGKILGLGKTYADAGTAIYLASQKTALSAEALSVVKSAADVSGSSIQEFAAGFTKFERALATGGGKVKSTFEQMGIDISKGAKDPEAAFGQFLDKFRQLPDDANRSAVAMQLFGKAGANQIPTFLKLAESGKSFAQMKDEAVELGLAFDSVGAKKAKNLEDAFTGLDKAGKGLIYSLAGGFAEPLTAALKSVTGFAKTLRPIFTEIGEYVGAAISYVASGISSLIGYFSNLSPETKKVLGIFTLLTGAIGSVVAAIAGFAAAASVSSVFATISTGVAAAAAALSEFIIPIAAAAAAAAALYLAWETNFGGIRDFTLEAWEGIKSATSAGIEAVSELTAKIGGEIVAWWRENYPLIQETVKTVSDFIKTNIQSALDSISEFWKAHGEQIMAVVKAAWSFISDYIGGTIQDVLSVIKAVMQTINGDWSGAWESIGEIAGREMKFIYETVGGTGELILSAVKQIGDYIANNFDAAMVKTGDIVTKGLLDILDAFVNLPAKIVEYAPKFYNAGIGIGEAIIKGFWKGMKGASGFGGNDGEIIDMSGLGSGPGASGGGEAKSKLLGLTLTQANANFKTYQETAKAAGGLDLTNGGGGKTKDDLKKILDQYFIGKKLGIGDGLELRKNLEALLNNPQTKLFLETVKVAEGGSPNIMAGGRKVSNLDTHPGNQVPRSQWFLGPKGRSSASGNWQETLTNWQEIAPQLGLKDFSVKNQAIAALEIMRRQSTKGFIELAKGNLEGAFMKGTQPWASSSFSTLPGGKKDYLKIARNLKGGTGFESSLDSEITASDKQSKILQDIAEAYLRINALITTGGDENQKQLDVLQTYESNLKDIQKQVELINNSGVNGQLVVGLPDTPEDAAKMVERLKALTDLQNSVKSSNDSAKEKLFELSQQMTDGLTDLEKFDYGLQQLRASGKLTADDFALLSDGIDAYRQNLKKITELETAQKLASEAKAVSSSLSEMADGFKTSIGELGQNKDLEPFTGFIDQIKQIKELDLPTDAFSEFKTAISPNGIDTEKLASVARFWLEVSAAVGGTDPAQIDAIVSKLTQSAAAFNQLNDAQKAAKNAEDYKGLTDNLDNEYQGLMRNGRELTVYEQTLKDLQDNYKNLSEAEKDNLLAKAAQIDAVRSAQESYDKLRGIVGESVDAFANGGFKGLFQSIKDRFKNFLKEMITEWLTSKIFGVFSGKSLGGASGNASNQSGGLFGNLFKGLFGGSSSSGSNVFGGGSQGNGIFNLGSSSGGSSAANPFGDFFGDGKTFTTQSGFGGVNPLDVFNVSGGKSGFNLKNIFGKGGIFGDKGFGSNTGTFGAIGTGAGLLGNLVGGRFGSVLGGAGSGLALGAQLGSIVPGIGTAIGAGVGAIVGGLFGLFGGNKKEKADKAQLSQFNQSFGDALQQLRDLSANRNAILQDPGGAVAKAQELRNQIASGFGAQFQSKKYQKQAQATIQSNLVQADTIIAQIKAFADRASGARELDGHIIGEFAGGNYFKGVDDQMADMVRLLDMRRGYINGGQLGVDRHLGLFADGEMILNQRHQQNIINAAGFDVIAHSGVPNYPKPKPMARYADGASFGTVSPLTSPTTIQASDAPINLTINIRQDAQGNWHGEADSDAGRKVIAKIVEDKFYNGELKLKKRTA